MSLGDKDALGVPRRKANTANKSVSAANSYAVTDIPGFTATNQSSYIDVTGSDTTIQCSGNPVRVMIVSSSAGSVSLNLDIAAGTGVSNTDMAVTRNGELIGSASWRIDTTNASQTGWNYGIAGWCIVDLAPPMGECVYKLQLKNSGSAGTKNSTLSNARLLVREEFI